MPLTEDRVRNIMNEMLQEWERTVGGKRHDANIVKFDELFRALNMVRGFVVAFGVLLTVLKIADMLGVHK